MSIMTLNDYFPDFISPLNKGLFSDMLLTPWVLDSSIDTGYLDILYFTKYGQRPAAPICRVIGHNKPFTDGEREIIAGIIQQHYATAWKHLWEAQKLEYNPIENYSMTESGQDNITNAGTVTSDNTLDHGHISESVSEGSGDTHNKMNAMNSVTAVDVTSGGVTQKDKVKNTNSGADKNHNVQVNDLHNDTVHALTRSGNIGVTTSQQMLQSEFELWQWNYFEQVFADINKLLTLPIY